MSIQRLYPDDFEQFTLELHPERSFVSSSKNGSTGSIRIFPRGSKIEKDVHTVATFNELEFDENSFSILQNSLANSTLLKQNIFPILSQYLSGVNVSKRQERKNRTVEISRFIPDVVFGSASLRKIAVKEQLIPYYRNVFPTMNWNFSNYHCINFFTASSVPNNSVLLYPNSASNLNSTIYSGIYSLTESFTFDFWLNPRYTTDQPNGDFKAGTLFHLSSSYAISLVSGSRKDLNGYVNGYRLLLQLSHSADTIPSKATKSNYPNDLIFLSNDNSLFRNRWHHVSIRWGGANFNNGSGSFYIDGEEKGTFVLPSSSLAPLRRNDTNPDVLCIGNFYEGRNLTTSTMSRFFSIRPSVRFGLKTLIGIDGIDGPNNFVFNHPLNAEVHDLKIFSKFLNDKRINELTGSGIEDLENSKQKDKLVFYVPPFFVKETPKRREVEGYGGVMVSPFFTKDTSTSTPFNTDLSFGIGGHDINLENFLREFVSGEYPRMMELTSSQITGSTQNAIGANEFLYATASLRKRNLTILPCDNGYFYPNFDLLRSGSVKIHPEQEDPCSVFVDDFGFLDIGSISLNKMISTSSIRQAFTEDSGSLMNSVVGARPGVLDVSPGDVLTILQRTRDDSSNEVVFFDIPNLYYGNKIQEKTFKIFDTNISGSDGKIKITLKDDGNGNLYRSDADGEHATWSSVGNLLYNEGIAIIKSPIVPFFGKDQFQVNFKGTSNIHTMKISVMAPAGQLNSSSNPSYKEISASLGANEVDGKFVYITGINFHDKNLNVVMKSQLAQPIKKRFGNKINFKIRMDF